jgi:hypothetical protein
MGWGAALLRSHIVEFRTAAGGYLRNRALLTEYGSCPFKGYLKLCQERDLELLRAPPRKVVINLAREHATPFDRGRNPAFLNANKRLPLASHSISDVGLEFLKLNGFRFDCCLHHWPVPLRLGPIYTGML